MDKVRVEFSEARAFRGWIMDGRDRPRRRFRWRDLATYLWDTRVRRRPQYVWWWPL